MTAMKRERASRRMSRATAIIWICAVIVPLLLAAATAGYFASLDYHIAAGAFAALIGVSSVAAIVATITAGSPFGLMIVTFSAVVGAIALAFGTFAFAFGYLATIGFAIGTVASTVLTVALGYKAIRSF